MNTKLNNKLIQQNDVNHLDNVPNRLLKFLSVDMQFTESEMEEYEKLSTFHEQIKYSNRLIVKYDLIPEYKQIDWEIFQRSGHSIFFSSVDNRKRNEFRLAIHGLNSALCYVSTNDNFLADCFIERAVCFLALQMFEQCLSSLILAKTIGNIYCIQLMARVRTLEISATKGLECLKTQIPRPITPTQYVVEPDFHCKSKSKTTPFVDSCIELMVDCNGVGLGLKTTSDLNVGDIIIIESGLIETLGITQSYSRCEYCFQENGQDLIPCRSCTSAMYCSDSNCLMDAWEKYHKYECPIMDFITFCEPFRLVTRLVVTTFRTDEDIEDFIEFTKSPNQKSFNAFAMDWSNRPRNFAAKLLSAIDMRTAFPTDDCKFSHVRMTSYLIFLLRTKTNFLQYNFNTTERIQFLADFIYHNMFITMAFSQCQFSNSEFQFTSEMPQFSLIAKSINIFQTLLRHSSCANTAMTSWGLHRSVIYVQRSVKKGEELFLDYSLNYGLQMSSTPENEINPPRYEYNPMERLFVDHGSYFIEDPTKSIQRFVLTKIKYIFLLNTETVLNIMQLAIDYITENEHRPIYMEFYYHLRILYFCQQRLYGMPIFYDFSVDGIYNIKYTEWVYANRRLLSIFKQYKKKYGNNDEVRNQLKEFLLPALVPRIHFHLAATCLLEGFNFQSKKPKEEQTPLEYFQQFGTPKQRNSDVPAKYEIVEAFQRLSNVFPTLNYVNDNVIYSSDDESELIENFRNFYGIKEIKVEEKIKKKKTKNKNKFKRR